jgi:hypothetical protein
MIRGAGGYIVSMQSWRLNDRSTNVSCIMRDLRFLCPNRRGEARASDGGPKAWDPSCSISPDLIDTGATRAQLEDPEWAGCMLGKAPLGRIDRPKEVANIAQRRDWTA